MLLGIAGMNSRQASRPDSASLREDPSFSEDPGQPPGNRPPRPRAEPTRPEQEPSLGIRTVDTKGRVYWIVCLETREGNALPQE
ncbi:hypothetical protein Celaphus_00014655 [Cervus elaphus hippelaphus]|uniref:Uncharacterized protein n=1 Tax=Cervus elaphus hippelaphus TaxID=46360 RepID=A0A212D494_CEREH|nr:hypothetical protein Celaphus_00014655 [Cervus elaphus hippelaphus]